MGDYEYAFKPDLVIREAGVVTVVDYKFVYDFYDDDMLHLIPQIPRYIGALRALEIPAIGGLYFFLRYRNVKGLGEGNRFKLHPTKPSTERIKNGFRDLDLRAREILLTKRNNLQGTRIGNQMICKSCSFKDLCVAELNGSDGKILRATEYTESTYGYVQTEEPTL
jgi:hypothetical protein